MVFFFKQIWVRQHLRIRGRSIVIKEKKKQLLVKSVLPDWAENHGLGYFCFFGGRNFGSAGCGPEIWTTFKNCLADL